jgi:hypothetical protein
LILGAEPGLRIRRWPSRAARCSLSHPAFFRGLMLRLAVAARRRLMAMHRRWRDFLNRPSRTGSRSRRGALAGVGGDADDGGGRPDDCRTEGGRWYRWRRSRPSIHPFPPAGRGAPGWPCVGWSCLRRPPDRRLVVAKTKTKGTGERSLCLGAGLPTARSVSIAKSCHRSRRIRDGPANPPAPRIGKLRKKGLDRCG